MTDNSILEIENRAISDDFLAVLEDQGMSDNTLINYNTVLKRVNLYLLDKQLKHHDITLADMYAYIATLSNYKAQTRNLHLTCLNSFYSYMVSIGARRDIPILKHMRAKVDRTEPDYLDRSQRLKYISFLQKHSNGDQVVGAKIMLASGLRISEIMSMDLLRDIEFRDNKAFIRVRRSKSRKERICPIFDPNLTSELKSLISMYFPLGSYNLNLYNNSYLYANQKFYKETGIKVTPHILRYTFATDRASEGLSIDIIRRLLGHRFYTTTLMYIVENQQQIYNLI